MLSITDAKYAQGTVLPVGRERRRVVVPASRHAASAAPFAGPAAPADRHLESLRLLG